MSLANNGDEQVTWSTCGRKGDKGDQGPPWALEGAVTGNLLGIAEGGKPCDSGKSPDVFAPKLHGHTSAEVVGFGSAAHREAEDFAGMRHQHKPDDIPGLDAYAAQIYRHAFEKLGFPKRVAPAMHRHLLAEIDGVQDLEGIAEAPRDGRGYVRRDGLWAPAPVGLPPGGRDGDTLVKKSDKDFEVKWQPMSVQVIGSHAGPPGPAGSGGAAIWGAITGTLALQTDLQSALDGKCSSTDPRLSDARAPTAHALTNAVHAETGLTTGHFLKATGATTFGFAAHGLTAADVGADATGTASAAVSAHVGASDPHTQYQKESEKGAANGYASLDAAGLVPTSQLPSVVVSDFLGVVGSQVAMLALRGEKGDWCNRSDEGKTYIIITGDGALITDWQVLVYPTAPVISVNGQTAVVVLGYGDVGADAAGTAAAAVSAHEGAADPHSTAGYVKGRANLTTATRLMLVSAAGTATEAAGITTDGTALTFGSGSGVVQEFMRAGSRRLLHSIGATTNLFAGQDAGNLTLTSTGCAIVGYEAGKALTSGSENSILGASAFVAATTAQHCTAAGTFALAGTIIGGNNTAFGWSALKVATTGENTAVGCQAGISLSTGTRLCAIGMAAAYSTAGGNDNTALGNEALYTNISGSQSVATGYQSLFNATASNNSALGMQSGASITTGANGVYLGYKAGYHASQKVDAANVICIGANSYSTIDNACILGAPGATAPLVGINTATPTAQIHINARTAATIGAIIRGEAAQTASLQEWQDSSGAVRAKMSAEGNLYLGINSDVTYQGRLFFARSGSGTPVEIDGGGSDMFFRIANRFRFTTQAYPSSTTDGYIIAASAGLTNIYTSSNGRQVGWIAESTGNVWGAIGFGAAAIPNAAEVIIYPPPSQPSLIGLVVRGLAAQTGNLQEWQDSSSVVGAKITAAKEFSNTCGQTRSEAFGAGALCSDIDCVAVGRGATLARKNCIAIGSGANVTAAAEGGIAIGTGAAVSASNSVALGTSVVCAGGVAIGHAVTSTTGCVVIGNSAVANGNDSVAIGVSAHTERNSVALGRSAIADASSERGNIAIGASATASTYVSTVIGRGATATAEKQFVAGSGNCEITDIYWGNGVTHATPTATNLHGTSGSGTDIAGANLALAAGQGTGAGAGGSLLFQVAPAGGSGSSPNALATALTIASTGTIALFKSLADANKGLVVQRFSATQSANLVEYQSSAAALLAGIDKNGQRIFATVNAAGATPVDTDVTTWGNETAGVIKGTGGRIFFAFKNAADVYYVEATAI